MSPVSSVTTTLAAATATAAVTTTTAAAAVIAAQTATSSGTAVTMMMPVGRGRGRPPAYRFTTSVFSLVVIICIASQSKGKVCRIHEESRRGALLLFLAVSP